MLPPMPSKRINARVGLQSPLENILNRDERLMRINSKPLSRQSINISNDEENSVKQKVQRHSNSRSYEKAQRCQSSRQISIERSLSRERGSSRRSRKPSVSSNKIINIAASDIANLPYVTAKSWVIYEMSSETLIYGKKRELRRQVASLTKIANFITILDILEEQKLQAAKIQVGVSKEAASMIGTTAELREGMVLSLRDLFYGMMLPSGNDAAFLIAQFGGTLISLIREHEKSSLKDYSQKLESIVYEVAPLSEQMARFQDASVSVYLNKMNNVCRLKAKAGSTHFANPHGLSNVNSLSTAEDMARISSFAMKNPRFREVVQAQNHSCHYRLHGEFDPTKQKADFQIEKEEQVEESPLCMAWVNTNKMLWRGWSGVKTGITPNAGPCLSASVSKEIGGKRLEFLVILLKSYSMEARWKEVEGLVQWASELVSRKSVILS